MYRPYPLQYFPGLSHENHSVESPRSEDYNCIAWACGLDDRQLWPATEDYEWPADLSQEEDLDSFIMFFAIMGYQRCEGPEPEIGFEKIAIYALGTEPTHTARQLPSGKWTSKMGFDGVDIEHDDLGSLEGPRYGQAHIFLRRRSGRS